MRYIHRLMSHTVNARGQSEGVVNLKDLWALYCIKNEIPCNITMLFCKLFLSNATATGNTPIFGGPWILNLYKAYGEDTEGTMTSAPVPLNFERCYVMGLVLEIERGVWRFRDNRNQIWDPEDPEEMMIQDVEERRQSPPRDYRRRSFYQPAGPHPGAGASSSHDSRYTMEGLYGLFDQFSTNTDASFTRISEQITASNAQQAAGHEATRQRIDQLSYRMDRQWGPFDPDAGN